jgi:hypothetical protein
VERSERLSLIKKIGLRLGDENFTDLDLTLSIFELPTSYWGENDGYADQYAYAVDQLKSGSDAQLAELHRHLFPDDLVADGLFDILARHPTTAETLMPAIVRRYVNSDSFDNTRAAFVLLETIPRSAWTDAMVEQVERASSLNSQVGDAVLPGGRKVPDAVRELLSDIRPSAAAAIDETDFQPASAGLAGDDDIPF